MSLLWFPGVFQVCRLTTEFSIFTTNSKVLSIFSCWLLIF